jgi:hypothetical protein
MKKLFLIPLLALMCSVMAWGSEVVVNDFATLKTQLSASGTADVVKLGQDITYEGTAVLDIQRSLTLDGQGHKIIGFKTTAIKTDGKQPHNTSIAINAGQFGSTAELDVTIKNLSVGNPSKNARYYGIIAYDGVKKLTLDNIKIETGDYGVQQGLCFTGTSATPIQLSIANSYINVGKSAYSVYILKPVVGTVSNSTIEGWCGLYFKYRATPMYGAVVGSRGSNITCENCNFVCPNIHYGASNGFAIFPIEDDGITLKLINCGLNKDQMSDQWQGVFSIQYRTRTEGYQPINIEVSGDNTYVFNATLNDGADAFVAVEDNWWNGYGSGYEGATVTSAGPIDIDDTPISIAFKGGTYSVNPNNAYFTNGKGGQSKATIPSGYEVKEIETQQGEQTTTLYRVRQIITGSTALNDNAGQNPTADIKVTDNVALANEETIAEYVEVAGGESTDPKVTVTVPEGKTLEVTNGLDVTGNAEVVVEAGSTVVVGEGGIISENPSNVVIEANENGAASLLLDPKVVVNTTPNLTVKMKAKAIGWMNMLGEKHYFWHRFALPIQECTTWVKNPNKSTYVFGWNYSANNWEQLSALTQMVPFKGYTLSADYENLGDVEYTFTGQLAGNTNNALNFERNGFNFFGNSYTGYIDVLALVDQIMGDNKIDGTVWMWYQENQSYVAVPLQALRENPSAFDSWMREVAPMQTFILKQNGSENATAELNYASAVWGNPRYGHSSAAPAPRRAVADEITRMRIVVTAENGKSDFVMFTEDAKFTDAMEKGYDGEKYMNENALNMYATVNGADYTAVATDNVEGKTVTIKTIEAVNYTMSFAKVNGEEYAIRDNVTGKVIAIEEGTTYEFAAQPNSTVEGRFEIVPASKVATAIENTEVKANVKGIYTITGQYLGENFDILPAGIYVVDGVKIVK